MSNVADIYTKGYVKFYEPNGLDLIRINDHKLLNTEERARDNGKEDIDHLLANKLNLFGQYLHNSYILPEWPDAIYNKYLVWDGVDKDNQGWHTDMFEDYDVFFLYYLDHTYKESGGAINFKWDGDRTASYQPIAGDLFMISNIRGFWHKADDTKIKRRVCSFDYSTGRTE
jgi:hypothetical protein